MGRRRWLGWKEQRRWVCLDSSRYWGLSLGMQWVPWSRVQLMAKHSVGLGAEQLGVQCKGGGWRGGMLSQDLSEGWRGTRLAPGSVLPMAAWLQLHDIVLWAMGLEGTTGDIFPLRVGGGSTESAPAVCPACPP